MADRRENRVPLSLVEPLEDVAMQLGVAVRRMMAEEALQRSERDKSLILNSTSEMFAYYDPDLRIQWANRIMEESLGLPQEQIVGRHCYELRHQRTTPCEKCPLVEAIKTRKPQEAEIHAPNGQVLFLRGFPLLGDDGQITGLVEIGENITARKQAQEAQRKSEERFRAIFDNAAAMVGVVDFTGRWLHINQYMIDLLGYSHEEFIQMRVHDILVPEDLDAVEALLEQLLRREIGQCRLEWRALCKDGRVLSVDLSVTPLHDEQGNVEALLGVALNITDQKNAVRALQESEAKFRAIADYTGDVEIWIGPDGQPVWINPAIERFTGYTVQECMAMPDFPASLIHVDDRPRMLEIYQQASAGSSGNDVHYRLLRRDGSFLWASISWQPIFGLDGVYLGWRSSHRDVTDRVQAEEALRLSESALQAAQRVAHVGSWSWHIPSGRIEWSEEMFRIFGVPKERFSGDLTDIVTSTIHPEDRAAVNRVNEAVVTEYRHSPLEFRIVWPDGSIRVAWAEAGELTLDKHGRPLLLTGIVQDITDRKQAEHALQISLQTSDDIVRTIPSGLFIYQFEPPDRLILVSGNPEAERLTGVRVDQCRGREFDELWPKARGLGHTEKFLEVMRTGRTFVSDDMQYPAEASAVFLRVRAFVLPQSRLAIAFDDVTEHRKAEQSLREREEVYSAIVNQAADSIVLVDAETWRFVEFNDAACQGLGYTRDEFARISLREIQGVLSASEVTRRVQEIMQAGKAGFENKQRRKDGTFRDVLVSNRLVPIRGHDYFVGVWRDITERKKVEEALRESRERFRSLYESVQAGVMVQRADGTITHCNRIACETFGVDEDDVRSQASHRSFWHMTMEDGTPVADADYPSGITLRTGEPIRGVVRGFYREDPERLRWLLINTEPRFKTNSRELDEVIITFQDITEQKRAQQRAEQRQAELLHVSRLSTLGEMASGFAHELNQPLSAIMSYASASLRSVQTGQFDVNRLTANLGHVVAQSGRAGEIIRRVRAFAQRRPLRLGPLDLNGTVREAIELLGSDARHKGIELTLDLSTDLPSVLGDSIQIEQVLLNLMRNAIEAMEAVEPQRRRLILRTFAQSRSAVAVAVSDTGPGMSEEMMAKVFDAFFTTKESGLGIGLSISRSIIESHRGQFWVASGPDGGCTFTFTLPAVVSDSANGPVAAPKDQDAAPHA